MLAQRVHEKTGEKEWCLVSRKDPSKILEWYGKERPSDEQVQETEDRVQYFKHFHR
jgi:hypothetical protein